ncbi:MAG TPA: BTAD domain-containing putative transcriptional regulator [Streptosporangiaceae bacterium]|nr:BTAD domain-containing putative transcriptional regulator [Streptosporangiaceae bacterium]
MLRVGVLGPVTAWEGDQELRLGQPRQQAVLGILAVRANRVISRGELVDAVWGHEPPPSAEGGIYTYIAGLRRVIEPSRSARGQGRILVSTGAGYVLHLVPGQQDAVAFEQHLGRARQLRKGGDPAGAVSSLDAALGLWRGVAFAGVPGPFAETERARLGELRSAAAEERADVLLALGRHEEVVPDLTAMVADQPRRERMRGLLMIALYRSGRQAEALRVFQDGKRALAEELGIDPGVDLTRIHQQILSADPALNLGASPGTPTVTGGNSGAPGSRDGAGRPDDGGGADGTSRTGRTGVVPAPRHGGPEAPGEQAVTQEPGSAAVHPAPEPGVPVPAQLPLEAQGFAGRQDELRMLQAMLPPARRPRAGESVPVAVISGTAGVGKTSLAIRFGRQVAKRFPDGQLYVNLRGLDPGQPAMEPVVALWYLLAGLGVPQHRVHATVEERAAMYRSLVDGKRILVVLDNATSAAQVRPLLPGSPGCLVVVTSRNDLAGLVAAEGAALITLDVLSHAEAREMLARRLGRDRVAAEPEAADEIIEECARLPLALSIAVGRAAGRARHSLADLAAELRDAKGSLDALEAGDAATDMKVVLSWSYDQLSEPAARMFRLLGVHPGPDISSSAAASLAGMPRAKASAALRELSRTHMVAEYLPGRFAFHNLLRAYAADLAERRDTEQDRHAAAHRMLDHYLHTAMAASQLFSPGRLAPRVAAPQPGVLPGDMADKEQAMAWFDAEHPVLIALIRYAYDNGFDSHAWQIPWSLGLFFNRRGWWRSYVASQETALRAAQRLGDPLAQAHAHYLLGHALANTDDYAAADPNVHRALDLFRELGDRANEAMVLNGLSNMLEHQGRHQEALAVALDALRMLKAAGHWWTQAGLENMVGWLYAHLGQNDQALAHCQRSLGLHRESGNRGGTADTMDSLGFVYRQRGDLAQAKAYYRQALDAYREIAAPYGQGHSLDGLGDVLAEEGDLDAAREAYRAAAAILDTLPHPLADEVRTKLRGLDLGAPDPGTRPEAATTARSV